MSDGSGASTAGVGAESASPQSGDATANAVARPTDQTREPKSSGPSGATPPKIEPKDSKPKQPQAKTQSEPEDDDPEEDVGGEKVKRSEIRKAYERRKEWERANHAKAREIAETRKQVESQQQEILRMANMLRAKEQGADPFAIHRAAGASDEEIDAIAEARLVARMKRAQMTPEQIEAEQIRAENAKLKKQFEEQQEQAKKQKLESLKAHYKQHWDKKIADAMTAGNLARTASTGAKVAQVIAQYMQAGEDIDPALAAQIVRDNHQTEIRHEFTELRDQAKAGRITQDKFMAYVTDLIGADTVKAIQASAVKQAQNFEPQKPRVQSPTAALPKQKFASFEEANAWIEKRMKAHG